MKEIPLTITNDDNVEQIEHLCAVTGLTPPCLVALLARKYGKDLEQWLGRSSSSTSVPEETSSDQQTKRPPLELPTDPGEGLRPVEL
jgi:hypothetical protein